MTPIWSLLTVWVIMASCETNPTTWKHAQVISEHLFFCIPKRKFTLPTFSINVKPTNVLLHGKESNAKNTLSIQVVGKAASTKLCKLRTLHKNTVNL